MTKKAISLLLTVLLAGLLLLPATAAGAHEHTGVLEGLRTDKVSGVSCCGVFRCTQCGETYNATVTPADVGLPIVQITGSLSGISKTKEVQANISFDDGRGVAFTSAASFKWQGGTSTSYPKKNYTVKLLTATGSKNKLTVVPAWGKQSKYCLKANWVDYSAARNVVSARLWGEIVHSRCKDDPLDPLVNGGGVDGFPVLLYQNGVFHGLYTFNTPKDNWIFGMSDSNVREGLLFGDVWSDSTFLFAPIANVNKPEDSGWEVEYCATEDDPEVGTAWLSEGMNRLINFLIDNDGAALKAGLGDYTDVDRAIDLLLFTAITGAADNTGKNILWATWDGVKYVPSAYDLDALWGLKWNGELPDNWPGWDSLSPLKCNLLFKRLIENYSAEIKARYKELRADVLSSHNIQSLFNGFAAQIPAFVYTAEAQRWPGEPGLTDNRVSQILSYAESSLAAFDAKLKVTVNETADSAYRAAFACENGAQVFVYPSQDYTADPVRAATAWSVNGDTGELTRTDGQINFRVNVPEGYLAQVEVTPADGFKNLKTPADTGAENVYRITKITRDLTVRVRLEADTAGAEGYPVSFVAEPGIHVWVYTCADYNETPSESLSAVSVESATGVPTKTDGQVNFLLTSDEPNDGFEVTVSPNAYKNLKGPAETCQKNTYRITKISGELTVTVKMIPKTPGSEDDGSGSGNQGSSLNFLQRLIDWLRRLINTIRGWFSR